MKIAVVGLWHLGTVTASALAAEGHDVIALDSAEIVASLNGGSVPVDEPGLRELIAEQRAAGRLRFAAAPADASGAELVWFTYDTPVDDDDNADVAFVIESALAFLAAFPGEAVVAISSQVPVGSGAQIAARAGDRFRFAAIPENLRLGSAIAYFRKPDRFVVGTADAGAREVIGRALAFAPEIVWMGLEAAEMTKHAINAFLATSVVFANELAAICERVGADAREVERGLKSDLRVGPKAYVRAGEAFAGGTLARDVGFLSALGARDGVAVDQVRATATSNERHRNWPYERVRAALAAVGGSRVALLGLVYKPGTDTLRASTAVALARQLRADGVTVVAFDPAIPAGDARLDGIADVAGSAAAALAHADVVAIGTAWPEFKALPAAAFANARGGVVDVGRVLEATAGAAGVPYFAFGRPDTVRA